MSSRGEAALALWLGVGDLRGGRRRPAWRTEAPLAGVRTLRLRSRPVLPWEPAALLREQRGPLEELPSALPRAHRCPHESPTRPCGIPGHLFGELSPADPLQGLICGLEPHPNRPGCAFDTRDHLAPYPSAGRTSSAARTRRYSHVPTRISLRRPKFFQLSTGISLSSVLPFLRTPRRPWSSRSPRRPSPSAPSRRG